MASIKSNLLYRVACQKLPDVVAKLRTYKKPGGGGRVFSKTDIGVFLHNQDCLGSLAPSSATFKRLYENLDDPGTMGYIQYSGRPGCHASRLFRVMNEG